MKIRRYLRLNVVFSLAVPLLVGALLFFAYAGGREELGEIRQVSGLRTLLGDLHEELTAFSLHPDTQHLRAWRARQHLLQQGLQTLALDPGREQQILHQMREADQAMAQVASRLENHPIGAGSGGNRRHIRQLEKAQVGLQRLAVDLTEVIEERIWDRYRTAGLGAFGAALVLALFFAGMAISSERRLVPRLQNVERGLRRFGGDDLAFRLHDPGKDELGDLARAFDELAGRQERTLGSLRTSEAKYRTLVENLPQKVYLKDPDLVYVSCNDRFARARGLDPEKVAGKTDFDLFPQEEAEMYRRLDRQALAAGELAENREYHRVDGKEIWLDTLRTPIRDESGEVSGLLGVSWDVTARIETEARAQRLAAILENTPDYVATADVAGNITWINPAGLRMLGLAPDADVTTLNVRDTHPEWATRMILDEGYPTSLREGSWSGENALLSRDGGEIPVLQVILAHKDPSGAILYCSTIARDLSERKRAEEEVHRLNRDLERRVEERTAELERTVVALREEVEERQRVEASLRESESLYRTLVENIDLGITLIDAEFRVRKVNTAMEKFLEKAKEEFLGKACYQEFEQRDHRCSHCPGQKALESGRQQEVEIDVPRPGGSESVFRIRAFPLFDDQKRSEGFIEVVEDITERKRGEDALRRSEERFRKFFELGLVGMAITTPQKTWREVNDRLCTMLGYSREELQAMTWVEMTHPDDRAADLEQFQRLVAGEADNYTVEKRFLHHDGTVVEAFIGAAIVRGKDGTPDYLVKVVQDITQRKMAERSLEGSIADLQRSNQELEQFAYVASHDLQEPLRMVGSYVQLLARRYRGRLDADADDFIGYAAEGAARMQTLIEDLLQLSRVGRREESFTAVDCNEVLATVLQSLKAALDKSGGKVVSGPLPTVLGIASQIGQVFQNLIGNALKFRGDKPPVIEIAAVSEQDRWVFSVRDNGIGIDPLYFERIFVIFKRLHGKRDYPGTGIGLALTKKIVERHGGRIWVESEADKGSTFFFTLKGAE